MRVFDLGLIVERVLEAPSCRWSTSDANRLGIPPLRGVAATIQERAVPSSI